MDLFNTMEPNIDPIINYNENAQPIPGYVVQISEIPEQQPSLPQVQQLPLQQVPLQQAQVQLLQSQERNEFPTTLDGEDLGRFLEESTPPPVAISAEQIKVDVEIEVLERVFGDKIPKTLAADPALLNSLERYVFLQVLFFCCVQIFHLTYSKSYFLFNQKSRTAIKFSCVHCSKTFHHQWTLDRHLKHKHQ